MRYCRSILRIYSRRNRRLYQKSLQLHRQKTKLTPQTPNNEHTQNHNHNPIAISIGKLQNTPTPHLSLFPQLPHLPRHPNHHTHPPHPRHPIHTHNTTTHRQQPVRHPLPATTTTTPRTPQHHQTQRAKQLRYLLRQIPPTTHTIPKPTTTTQHL